MPELSTLGAEISATYEGYAGSAINHIGPVLHARPGGDDLWPGTDARPKKTILAAYDALPAAGGSAIAYGPGVDVGGEVEDQGLWIAGPHDPQYDALPPGWRKQKRFQLIGVGGVRNLGPAGMAYASVTMAGGSTTDRNMPVLCLARTTAPIRIVGMEIGLSRARPVVLGSTSDFAETNDGAASAGIELVGCAIRAAQTLGAGPVVEVDYAFDLWLTRCTFSANATADLEADERAAILVRPRGPNSAGLVVRDCAASSGGIKYYHAASGWGLEVLGSFRVESDFVNPVPPAVWLVNPNRFGTAWIERASAADAPGSPLPVRIGTPDGSAGSVDPGIAARIVVVQSGVDGPATVISSKRHDDDPGAKRQLGLWGAGGRVSGAHEASRRGFGPSAAQFSNLAKSDPADWTGATTRTPGQAAPDGTLGAVRISSTGGGTEIAQMCSVSRSLAQGDWLVIGGWIKDIPASGSLGMRLGAVGAGVRGYDIAASSVFSAQRPTNAAGWTWLFEHARWAGDAGTFALQLTCSVDSTAPVLVYPPWMLLHLPAAMPEAEVAEIARTLHPWPSAALPGEVCTLPSQTLRVMGGLKLDPQALADLEAQLGSFAGRAPQ